MCKGRGGLVGAGGKASFPRRVGELLAEQGDFHGGAVGFIVFAFLVDNGDFHETAAVFVNITFVYARGIGALYNHIAFDHRYMDVKRGVFYVQFARIDERAIFLVLVHERRGDGRDARFVALDLQGVGELVIRPLEVGIVIGDETVVTEIGVVFEILALGEGA